MGDDIWDGASTNCDSLNLEKLVGSLLGGDTVDNEAALDIVQDTEVFPRLLNADDILACQK